MSTETIGFTSSQILPANSLLRLTFGTRNDFAGGGGWDPFGLWPGHMTDVWQVLPNKAGLFPIVPANVLPGTTAATIDARTHTARSGADIINAVAAIDDQMVGLVRVELLTGSKAVAATGNIGAQQRDTNTSDESQRQGQSPAWWDAFKQGLEDYASGIRWALLLLVLICLAIAYRKFTR